MTKSGKHCAKRKNCSFWAISSFVTMFLKKTSATEASESVYMRERVNKRMPDKETIVRCKMIRSIIKITRSLFSTYNNLIRVVKSVWLLIWLLFIRCVACLLRETHILIITSSSDCTWLFHLLTYLFEGDTHVFTLYLLEVLYCIDKKLCKFKSNTIFFFFLKHSLIFKNIATKRAIAHNK